MQTKTIFRPALALLLCGAAMLGLGLWENAAGQGQTPILFSEDPQGFNECIANYGEFAIVGDEGDAQCTPRPPGWTPPAPVVVPDPGGIVEEDEPATPSPPRTGAHRRLDFQSARHAAGLQPAKRLLEIRRRRRRDCQREGICLLRD